MSVQPDKADALSTVFVWVPVIAPVDVSSDAVAVAFMTSGKPIDADWHGAVWDDKAARILIGPNGIPLNPGTYTVWVKITDDPEIPVIPSGSLIIT